MKRSKISFLAIIALLTVSLTAATKAHILPAKTKRISCTTNDWGAVNIASLGTNYYNSAAAPAPPAPSSVACPGETKFCGTLLSHLTTSVNCDGGNFFCCAYQITSECTNQQTFKVYCKSAQ